MGFSELLLIAVGLSMDAFAVAVCKGLKMRRLDIGKTAVIALFFGGFQALMPLLGWALGKQFERYITSIDHWIAFFLLLFIGGKMIIESFKKDKDSDEKPEYEEKLDLKELTLMAVATSIDALAVGVTFAFFAGEYPDIDNRNRKCNIYTLRSRRGRRTQIRSEV